MKGLIIWKKTLIAAFIFLATASSFFYVRVAIQGTLDFGDWFIGAIGFGFGIVLLYSSVERNKIEC